MPQAGGRSAASASPCPICGGTDRQVAATWAEWEASLPAREDSEVRRRTAEACGVAADRPDLLRCATCGSVSLDPLPRREQLERLYASYHMTAGFLAKAEKKVARARRRLRLISPLLPARSEGRRRMLEVGASIGTAAEAARRRGVEALALELDAAAIEEGKKLFPDLTFIRGRLEDVEGQERFELVYAAEVIEHVRSPALFIAHCRRLLVPGGLLFLTTPDLGHALRPEPLLSWGSVRPPEHIHLFTRDGMRRLLAAGGFGRVVIPPHRKPGMRVVAWNPGHGKGRGQMTPRPS